MSTSAEWKLKKVKTNNETRLAGCCPILILDHALPTPYLLYEAFPWLVPLLALGKPEEPTVCSFVLGESQQARGHGLWGKQTLRAVLGEQHCGCR